jgi:DNA end-binding protein Ku
LGVARAIWKAVLQFGPVQVPVKLYPAVKDTRTHAHLLHDTDRQRLQQRMVCPEDEEVVEPRETVKGYEIKEDEYVVVDFQELDVLEPEASREIEVVEFVDAGHVDPRYLDRTFFLGPDEDESMYVNLAESLHETKLAGMCRWVMRGKSYVGVLLQRDGLLSLITHRYADEIVPADSLEFQQVEPGKKEIAIARNLVEELEEEFHPEQYYDEYEAKLHHLIEQKAQGKEVRLPRPVRPEPTKEEDLVGVLQRSLETLRK